MSAISRTTAIAGAGAPRKTYIAMRPYYYDFFSYTTSVSNYLTTGGLKTVAGASPTLGQTGYCAQGAFLRETGRRLYPGANPGITTMMVSVFDFATGLTGFIDPNSEGFTPQNADRAYYIDSAGENPNSTITWTSDRAPPVYTHGDVLADGDMYIGENASTMGAAFVRGNVSTASNLYVGSNADIRLSTVSHDLWLHGSLTAAGPVRLAGTTNVGGGSMGTGTIVDNGGYRYRAVQGTFYNSGTSHVSLTLTGQNTGTLYNVSPTAPGNPYVQGTFWVVSNSTSDTASFSYLIINQ